MTSTHILLQQRIMFAQNSEAQTSECLILLPEISYSEYKACTITVIYFSTYINYL